MSHTIYAIADNTILSYAPGSGWNIVQTSRCPAPDTNGYYPCITYYRLWQHPLIDSLWYLYFYYDDAGLIYTGRLGRTAHLPDTTFISSDVGNTGNFILAFHPTIASKLYANPQFFAVSNSWGYYWTYPEPEGSFSYAPFISVDETLPDNIYSYTGIFRDSLGALNPAGIYRSTDDGADWSLTDSTFSIGGFRSVPFLARADTLLIGLEQPDSPAGISFSPDGGSSWSRVADGRSISCIVRDPSDPRRLFAGSVGDILRSVDGGASWTVYNNTLPRVRINQLGVDPGSDTLYAATEGAGMIQVFDFAVDVKEKEEAPPSEFLLYPNYPNPFNPTTTITFEVPQRAHVRLDVFNTIGQKLATLFDGEVIAGRHSVVLHAEGWASGLYIVRLMSQGRMRARLAILIR